MTETLTATCHCGRVHLVLPSPAAGILACHGIDCQKMHGNFNAFLAVCRQWRTVCIGSSGEFATPGTARWWHRMNDAMRHACDERGRPLARLHGLRMLDPAIFSRLPLASADSTNAAVNSGSLDRFGMYLPPTAAQRAAVIAERTESVNSAPAWIPAPIQADIFGAA